MELLLALALAVTSGTPASETIPATGQTLTPMAAPGSVFQPLTPGLADAPTATAGHAVSTVVSSDGRTLLILTSGFNRRRGKNHRSLPDDSMEYVFAYDISGSPPVLEQVIRVPNTFMGIAFAPDGTRFYVGGGVDDDVHGFASSAGLWSEVPAPGADGGVPFARLNHPCGNTLVAPKAFSDAATVCKGLAPAGTAGLAVTADGKLLVVANHENDSISLINLATGKVADLDLRPGKSNAAKKGVAGGEYPYWVAIKGNSAAYVSSLRDREVVVVNFSGRPKVTTRIPVKGNPGKMVFDRAQAKLYVACDNSDLVTVIDTATNTVVETIPTVAPPGILPAGEAYPGASPNSLALSPDEGTLYVTNGALNTLAVIRLGPGAPHQVIGLIPTGWYPNAVSLGGDGRMLYVVNGKSVPGPNPCHTRPGQSCPDENQYILQLEKAGFLSLPVPSAEQLEDLTRLSISNNFLGRAESAPDKELFSALRQNIKHVIYVLKENRTYDQMLGDLAKGNGDPSLTEFPRATTPNQHALATNFVTLDNFYDSGEVSQNGWAWSTAARELDIGVKTTPVLYAHRGYTLDTVGQDREVDVGIANPAARLAANPLGRYNPDPDLLPGIGNPTAPDAPSNAVNAFDGGYQQGHLWDSALRSGLTVRNYGFFVDEDRYSGGHAGHLPGADGGEGLTFSKREPAVYIPPYTDPASIDGGTRVAFASDPALAPLTDPYFRGYDNVFPDFYREKEWEREFDAFVDAGTLPNLELVRLPHDHTGDFATALYGVNTPELQQADNDYAVGKLVEKVAASPYAGSTLIFVVEDDAQNGPDHVAANRSVAFIAGPYVKHGALVSTRYSTVNFIRTMEDVLGIQHLNVFDAYQRPMSDVFDLTQKSWSYTATGSALLKGTTLPIAVTSLDRKSLQPRHRSAYWARVMKGFDFSVADHLDSVRYNRVLWQGLMGDRPYPTQRDGRDLRHDRDALLKRNTYSVSVPASAAFSASASNRPDSTRSR